MRLINADSPEPMLLTSLYWRQLVSSLAKKQRKRRKARRLRVATQLDDYRLVARPFRPSASNLKRTSTFVN